MKICRGYLFVFCGSNFCLRVAEDVDPYKLIIAGIDSYKLIAVGNQPFINGSFKINLSEVEYVVLAQSQTIHQETFGSAV